jgi:hypothetical protein
VVRISFYSVSFRLSTGKVMAHNLASLNEGGLFAARGFRPSPPPFWAAAAFSEVPDLVDQHAKLETVATGFGSTAGRCGTWLDSSTSATRRLTRFFAFIPRAKRMEVIALGDPDGNTATPSTASTG